MVTIAATNDDWAVDVLLPIGSDIWFQDNFLLAPMDAISAINQRHALFWPPGKPHPIFGSFAQQCDIKASPQRASQHRVAFVLPPASSGFRAVPGPDGRRQNQDVE